MCLFTGFTFPVKAQQGTDDTSLLPLQKAIAVARTAYDKTYLEKAINALKIYSAQGEPSAMHALGMIYYEGLGVIKDLEISRKWFESAAEKGYSRSYYNLAMMYRRGISVDQDFSKAYQYLCNSAVGNPNPQITYAIGYFLYKGFGCEQNYAEAIKYFETAAQKEHGYAMFMLGLCYRNGYGVEADQAQATYWLRKAANKNVKLSQEELNTDTPERPLQPQKLCSLSIQEGKDGTPAMFKAVKHEASPLKNISGEYSGMLVTYDWSGQHTIKEEPISVTIDQWDNDFRAEWQQEGKDPMEIVGILTDSTLVFTKAVYQKDERYESESLEEWSFIKASIKPMQEGEETLLTGNLQMMSSINKEPERPLYLTLRSNRSICEDNANEGIPEKVPITVYPNPFRDIINISFKLEIDAKCSISVHNMDNGMNLYEQQLGQLLTGNHLYQISLNVPPGRYLVKLAYGGELSSTVILKTY